MSKRPVLLFAEGPQAGTSDEEEFALLWRRIVSAAGLPNSIKLVVRGFNKGQLTAMHIPVVGQVPLDLLVSDAIKEIKPAKVLIAFDHMPRNELIISDCIRDEVRFVFIGLRRSKLLTQNYRRFAAKLSKLYVSGKANAIRHKSRPIDCILMRPMFENLLVHDEKSVLEALGLRTRPKDWPTFSKYTKRPDRQILEPAVAKAKSSVRAKIGGGFCQRKHAWGLAIVENMSSRGVLQAHPILERLEEVFG